MPNKKSGRRQNKAEARPSKEIRDQARYLAMVVRNAMEDFHGQYLSDAQMKELNPIIRNALCSALYALENYEKSERARKFVDFHWQLIPSYWEEPEIDDFLKRDAPEQ
jgi:RecB family exonuclease